MKTKKTKEAVSLIVLVLTIVIMIILAGVIIINLNNSGIIDRAKNAVSETNLKNMQELANVAWGEAYLAIKGEKTAENLKSTMLEKLKGKGVSDEELAKYTFTVTTGGVEVAVNTGTNTPDEPGTEEPEETGWTKVGFKVVKGDQELEIGDLVDYTATGTDYDGKWKVLGADDDGNLLIMSASDVDYMYFNEDFTLEGGQDEWLNGADYLDAACEPFGEGERAIDVRSIRVEDIDNVTGYDKTKYGEDTLSQYNNEVTYLYNGSTSPAYYSEVTGEGRLSGQHSAGFYFYNYDIEDFDHITAEELKSGEEGTEFAKLTSNYYAYNVDDVEITEKASLMLFDDDNAYYWLASPDVYADTYSAYFGMRCVELGGVYDHDLWRSRGASFGNVEYGVRAVVTLSSDITFTDYTEEDGWTY